MSLKDPEARRLYLQEYRKKNRETLLQKSRQKYQDNREQLLAEKRAKHAANPEHRRALQRLLRQKGGENFRAKKRDYYAANKQRFSQYRLKPSTKANNRRSRLRHLEKSRAYCRMYHRENRDKIAERHRKHRLENHARLLENFRKYQKANPEIFQNNRHIRRARQMAAPHDLTTAQWREIKQAYGYRCVYCGRKMQRLTQDHITPIARGGAHTLSNVVPACMPCNSKKYINSPPIPVQPLLLTLAPSQKPQPS